jgi:hypothetical protein
VLSNKGLTHCLLPRTIGLSPTSRYHYRKNLSVRKTLSSYQQIAMAHFDVAKFGPAWAKLLETDRCRALGPGKPDTNLKQKLQRAEVARLFSPAVVRDEEMADLCLAGAWLLADDLDRSHTISQQYETPTGSYWHGIMHRREADFANSKYWFRRVGKHPVFEPLAVAAQQLALQAGPSGTRDKLIAKSEWDPYLFVDLCAACEQGHSMSEAEVLLCREIAQAEWELLFAWCYEQAIE